MSIKKKLIEYSAISAQHSSSQHSAISDQRFSSQNPGHRTQGFSSRRRVLLLNNVPAPYFNPLFEKLGRESGWDLTVCYASIWNQAVGWESKEIHADAAHGTIILDERKPDLKKRLGSWNAAAAAILEILWQTRPDYLICYGYTLAPQLTLLVWAMITDLPFAVIGDANVYCDTSTGLKRNLRSAWLRLVARRASALITVGKANRMFWEHYGARPNQIFETRFAVDNDYFAQESSHRKSDAVALRAKLNLTKKTIFLFVGRLVKRKNVELIIKAAQLLNDECIAVVIVGAGEEKENLQSLAAHNSQVIFAGGISPSDLSLYYAMSDVLVLPASQEPWGLVVNEAMACGLAVIAHRQCGAAVDLVAPDNGVALQTFEVEEMAKAMKLIAGNEELKRSMQRRSLEKIADWSIDAAAKGIIRAVETGIRD